MEINNIYNLDCFLGFDKIPFKIDCFVTDPPFAFAGSISNGMSSSTDDQFFTLWLKSLFLKMINASNNECCWFVYGDWRSMYLYDKVLKEIQTHQSGLNFKVSQVLLHDREMLGMGRPFRNQVEYIAYIKNSKTNIDRIPRNTSNVIRSYWYYGKHKFHPAEKDINIFQKLIEFGSDEGNLICDPFIGSGTTALAAINCNRNFIGFEIEERFFLTAKKRIQDKLNNRNVV